MLAACGESGVPVPSDQFHRLSVGAPAVVYEKARIPGVLEVDRFRASDVLQDRAIVFVERDSPNVLHQYYYQLWADEPTRMLQAATIDYLREAHLADQVVGSGLRVVPAYTLSGEIKKLEHDLGSPSGVAVALEFSLREHKSGALVWMKSYNADRAVPNSSVAAATRAISEAVQEILGSLSMDLARR
jgi:cholesterol transport system auxiliary component